MANGAAGRPAGHHHSVSLPLPVRTHGPVRQWVNGLASARSGTRRLSLPVRPEAAPAYPVAEMPEYRCVFTGLVGCREISLPEDPQYEGEGNFQGPRLADPHRHLPVHLRPPRDGGVRFRPEDAGRHVAGKHGLLRIKNQPAGWLSAAFVSCRFTMAAVGRAGTLMGRMIRGTSKMASKSTNPLPDDHQPEGAGAVGLHPCPLGRQI